MLIVVGFEMPIMRLMKMDHDRHDFALVQLACSLLLAHATAELLLSVPRCVSLPEIIDMAITFG